MRITELTGVKQALAANNYKTVLAKNGFTPVGAGSFGTVWANPKLNYVLKTFNEHDSAYLEWVTACLANQTNPFLPRFLSKQPVRIVPGVLAVRLEKLNPLGDAAVVYEISDLLDDCTINADHPVLSPRGITQVMKENYKDLVPFADANPGLIPAVSLMANIITNGSGVNDLNRNNVMMRGQQMVFIDPI